MVSNLPFTNVGKLVGFLAKWFAIANWVVQFHHVNDDLYESCSKNNYGYCFFTL